jgi:hypothetical protein
MNLFFIGLLLFAFCVYYAGYHIQDRATVFICCMAMFCQALCACVNPGRVAHILATNGKPSCKICFGNSKPPNVHHCSQCNACVRGMDHHCPWINNCVGSDNRGYFILFLAVSLCASVRFLVMFDYIPFENVFSSSYHILPCFIPAFGVIFASAMLLDQFESIMMSREGSKIDRMKRKGTFKKSRKI